MSYHRYKHCDTPHSCFVFLFVFWFFFCFWRSLTQMCLKTEFSAFASGVQHLDTGGWRWRSGHCSGGPQQGGDLLRRPQGRLLWRLLRCPGARWVERRSDGCLLATASAMTAPLCLPGDYEISVKFNEQHVPDSPLRVAGAPPANAAPPLPVTGLQVRHQGPPPPPPHR